ncbi:nucleoside-diphosphate-sugar epimerase [Flavobacterium arsenatis]|uniref:Nucleoside-diphosphate-sugar epimerase n=1 Tax=Flavobacterium arsenatis TaxID=1484332 RepID=A0ABU1TLJ0_9FLAO|nr:SDR family oxidoreductase [Flavobacterium arsenatis]MDR6966838.1 nucleoside-diphosphate-sugar epimerase [Flavobacterium arsenatis]
MLKISILGCGWLGLPLAKALLNNGSSVKGSTTSAEKISVLQKVGISPFLISLKAEEIQGDATEFLENSSVLIIDIPPKLRGLEKENFVSKIQNLIPFIEKSSVESVLFISSTSVYGDDEPIVTEATTPNPETESGIQLLATEKLLQSNQSFQTTILRFGGLIGEDRHPIKFLAGRKDVENPEAPINMIHQDDCIGIILKIITTHSWDETFNAVAPFHPSREDYYILKAIELGLAPPTFNHKKTSVGKIIDATKVMELLGYELFRSF